MVRKYTCFSNRKENPDLVAKQCHPRQSRLSVKIQSKNRQMATQPKTNHQNNEIYVTIAVIQSQYFLEVS
jgi:hypothetical protein